MRFSLAALAACLLIVPCGAAAEPTADDLLKAVEQKLKAAHERAGPCVACVVVSRSELYPKPAKPPAHAGKLGDFTPAAFLKDNPGKAKLALHLDLSDAKSLPEHGYTGGVVVDASGLILTTYQPLEGATKVYVHLPGGKGSYADIHAADSRCDLAVLKLLNPPPGLKPIPLGDVRLADAPGGARATVFRGKLVVLMTNPLCSGFAFDKPSGGVGALSNVRRRLGSPLADETVNRSAYAYGAFLEHDAKLHAGISGAALLNLDGEMIGLTTQGHALSGAENGPGFAFPIDANARRIIDVLKRGEEVEYGYLGVTFRRGTLAIDAVSPHSPAWAAGIPAHQDQRITRINDVPVSDFGDLLFFATSGLAGTPVKVTVGEEPAATTYVVTLGKFKNPQPFLASVRPEPVFGLRVDHGCVLAQKVFRGFPAAPNRAVPPGVCVREVADDSPAAARFKTLGDGPTRWLITRVDGAAVTTPDEFYKAARGKPSIKLTVQDPDTDAPRNIDLTIP